MLIEKINYLATYTTILNEDRDVCVAETCTSKANNSHYTLYPSPAGRAVITRVECAWQRLIAAVSFLLISLVHVAMVDVMLSCQEYYTETRAMYSSAT